MKESKKNLQCTESQFNQMTHIAHLQGFVYPEGHPHAGKMNSAETIGYLLTNFQEKIA